jgi:hypothetical protein
MERKKRAKVQPANGREITWTQATDKAESQPSVPIQEGNICPICLEGDYSEIWMACPACRQPVAHLQCMREYVTSADPGNFRRCLGCNQFDIIQPSGFKSLFPVGWRAVKVTVCIELPD